jgi:predicted ATPase/class 3 adenylate cyclase
VPKAGTLTLLFTDLVGSTAALVALGEDRYDSVRDEHEVLVGGTIAAYHGEVVKGTGDGYMGAFRRAGDAVGAAAEIQRLVSRHNEGSEVALGVRIGISAGDVTERGGDYHGVPAVEAARLCAAANAGQILGSRAVVELARDVSWVDLGPHRLRGFTSPVEIHQAVAEGIGTRFPSLRTLDSHPNTLPRFRTEFFGRDDDIIAISRLLSSHRLVTLTGVGGSGKTRLAVEVAHEQLGSFPDGAYFGDLSLVTDADRVWDAIARGVELEVGGAPSAADEPGQRIIRFLSTRRALLVLDNCEHLLDAAADVVDQLLDATRHLTVLATSREGLHVDGETMVQVPSLPLETDAVRMFRERASASGAGEVDDEIARRVCERLDGLPLAIELAAARSGQLGAAEVAQRLSDRFQLLTGPGRRVPRQRTLEATLDWSHDLLHDDEKRALRRLAVFSGTFSLLAAEKVASAPADVIGSLVDKSLVQRGANGRFRLLDTVRAYAEDRLIEAGEGEEVRRAHVAWLVEQIGSFTDEEVILATSGRSDEFVAAELENLFAASAFAASSGDWSTVAHLTSYVALAEGVMGQHAFRPAARYLRDALDHAIDGPRRDRALAGYTAVGYLAAEPAAAGRVDLFTEAGECAWHGGDGVAIMSLTYLANSLDAVSRATGDGAGLQQARRLIERASTRAGVLGAEWEVLPTLFDGAMALSGAEWERAADRIDALTRLRHQSPAVQLSVWALWVEAAARLAVGRPLERDEIERRLADVRRRDTGPGAEVHASALGASDPNLPRQPIYLDRGQLDRSTRADATAVLISVAAIAAREGDWPVAARLLAAARGSGGVFTSGAGLTLYRLTAPQVRAALDKPRRDALIAEGREMGFARAADVAIEWLAMDRPSV